VGLAGAPAGAGRCPVGARSGTARAVTSPAAGTRRSAALAPVRPVSTAISSPPTYAAIRYCCSIWASLRGTNRAPAMRKSPAQTGFFLGQVRAVFCTVSRICPENQLGQPPRPQAQARPIARFLSRPTMLTSSALVQLGAPGQVAQAQSAAGRSTRCSLRLSPNRSPVEVSDLDEGSGGPEDAGGIPAR